MKNVKSRKDFYNEAVGDDYHFTDRQDTERASMDFVAKKFRDRYQKQFDETKRYSKEDLQKAFEAGGKIIGAVSDEVATREFGAFDFDSWFKLTYDHVPQFHGMRENVLPRPYKKVKCLECGEEVCDNINYKVGHLYNRHNCKPSVDDYKAKSMMKKYFA
jgi:hypothetical protein